ncbi:hypothetical protein AGABI2DRAFT_74074 [Agaricus bisporus var. bisporus H97]|uniref:hypothetical protein n=1 Tax=Agaricus bisporus var. bisporus (strain H97 / ATCC MYA-4626 / FGSC 10389) TaxID=936046 RepID=UPI00029F6524|nr:hypothetical protein AGABI2DRAFT_74074 [Agaricus bisporus var. bisporus H97]EKV45469.1 hypothetical protein AGABI2DRAFT_74074 [Agaricus bisporus var. bisporus H97]
MAHRGILLLLGFITLGSSQQIWDIWQTTWDRSNLFSPVGASATGSLPLNFSSAGSMLGDAGIVIDDASLFQPMDGFGATLTDSSASVLNKLKNRNYGNYQNLLNAMFNPTDGGTGAGLNYVRVPIGASDFSPSIYSLDDTVGDIAFSSFSIKQIPPYVFNVLHDILAVNRYVKVHLVPWSPPGWMKSGGTMNGGSLRPDMVSVYPIYLLKSVQGFRSEGIPIYAVSIQNEPQNSNPTYPSCTMTPQVEGQIGGSLRALLNNNGLSNVKIIGYEHNWDAASQYPVQLMRSSSNSFDGVAFHCYAGSYTNQDSFTSSFPSKEVYFTECTGTYGSDWWSDIKWYIDNLWVGSISRGSRTGLMWNFALDGSGNPKLPGTNSCGGPGCRPLVTVNSDGTYEFNQEFYAMAQTSKAILPKDSGGPFGQRIGVSVGGSFSWALRASAFVTGRVSSTDWRRYSIVVLNCENGDWDPIPVRATIEFRGMQAMYTFPVGVTTLWWFAPAR